MIRKGYHVFAWTNAVVGRVSREDVAESAGTGPAWRDHRTFRNAVVACGWLKCTMGPHGAPKGWRGSMKEKFRRYTFVLCCVFLFPACEKDNASGCNSARSTYLGTIEEYVAATRAGNFRESRRLLDRLTALSNNLDRVDANETVSAIEEAFRSLPLEAGDSSGDWELYRGSCKMAELMADVIWRLTNSPDRVIDFIAIFGDQQQIFFLKSARIRRQHGQT